MQKKLFLFSIIIMVLIVGSVSAQGEETSWWDSLINYFMNLFGISQEEAQIIAIETITPHTKEIDLGNNVHQIEIHLNIEFVQEDNQWKRKDEAKSLKGTGYECNVKSDGINLVECLDFNYTSRTLKLQRDSASLINVPLRKYENILNKTSDKMEKTYDSKYALNLNFLSKTETMELTIPAKINEIIEFGEHSTTVDITTNSTYEYYNDTRWRIGNTEESTKNYGGSLYQSLYYNSAAGFYYINGNFFNSTQELNSSNNITILNFQWNVNSIEAYPQNHFYFYICNELWDENSLDDVAGNSSGYWTNNSDFVDGSGYGTFLGCWRSIGNYMFMGDITTTGNIIINFTDLNLLSNQHNTRGYISWVWNVSLVDNTDGNIYSKEGTIPPSLNITWEVGAEAPSNTAPSDPILILNSTDSEQTNYTYEDLACNFLCDDPDDADTLTYDIDWIKNGIAQFGFASQSCIDPSYNSPILTNDNTTIGDLWSCSVNITDVGGLSSNTIYSDNVTINNIILALQTPTVVINSTYGSNLTNESLWCSFDCNDSITNIITYSMEFLENGSATIYSLLDQSCVNPSNNSIELTDDNITTHYFYSCFVNLTSSSGETINYTYSDNLTIVNTAPENINIVVPSLANQTGTPNNTIIYNCSAEDLDLDTIYYEYYQDANNPPTTLLANTTAETENTTIDGTYWWRCRAVDEYNGASDYSDARYLRIDNSTIKNMTYEIITPVYETSSNMYSFNVTINKNTTSSISTMTLNYNDVEYTPDKTTIIDDNNLGVFEYKKTVSTPISISSTDVIWNLTLTLQNGSIEEYGYEYTQTISPIQFDLCNTSLTDDFINLTFKDEDDNTEINASITTSEFIYSLSSNYETNKSLSFTNTTENFGYEFCFDPTDQILFLDMDVGYESTGYPQRNLVKNSSYTNTITTEILYLLKTASGIYSTFQVINPASQTLEDVYVLVERSISGSYIYVEQGYTDSAGAVTFFLNPDYTYRFTFTKSGYTTSTLTIKPTQSTYTVTMGQVITETKSYYTGVTYDIGPAESTVANQTDVTFTFNISSGYYSLEEAGFVLTNKSDYLGAATCSTETGCIASKTINTDNYTYIVMDYYWIIHDTEDKYMNGSRSWYVLKSGTRKSSITMAMEDIAKLGSGFGDFTKAIIVIAIIMFVIGSLTYYTGFYSPIAILAEVFFLVLFFDFGLDFIPEWGIVPHFISTLVGLLLFGYATFEWSKGGSQ